MIMADSKSQSSELKCKTCAAADKPMQRCPCKLKDAVYCSRDCQASDWTNHKSDCKSARQSKRQIFVVELLPNPGKTGDVFKPHETIIQGSHPIFTSEGGGVLSPVSVIVGFPLLVYRHLRDDSLDYLTHPKREDYDNQSVTYLMIRLHNGLAPAEWQQGVGAVTVARQDKKPLTKLQLEIVWAYCGAIIERFGDGEGPPSYMYSESAFLGWCREYKREAMLDGRKEFEGLVLPL